MLRKRLVLFLFLFPALAFAQTAAELDSLLKTDAVATNVATRFVMGAAGLAQPGLSGAEAETSAYKAALSKGWVKKGPEEPISLKETAFLMMNVFGLKGGVMYSIFHSPRYAYREMIYLKLIPGRTYANSRLSGQKFLQVLGKILNYTGEREQMDEVLRSSGVIN